MRKNQTVERGFDDGGQRRRLDDRRGTGIRRAADFERRLAEIEDLAQANRRELGLQFLRIAQIQADLDSLMNAGRSHLSGSSFPHEPTEAIHAGAERVAGTPHAAMPAMHGRRRS
jgi:hypothetical protein